MRKNIVIAVCVVIVLIAGIWVLRSRSGSSMYTERAQNLFSFLQSGQYQQFEAEFNSASRNGKIPKLLTDAWAKIVAECGSFKECTVLHTDSVNDGSINKCTVHLVCEFEKDKRYVSVTYDKTDRINMFDMSPEPQD